MYDEISIVIAIFFLLFSIFQKLVLFWFQFLTEPFVNKMNLQSCNNANIDGWVE